MVFSKNIFGTGGQGKGKVLVEPGGGVQEEEGGGCRDHNTDETDESVRWGE